MVRFAFALLAMAILVVPVPAMPQAVVIGSTSNSGPPRPGEFLHLGDVVDVGSDVRLLLLQSDEIRTIDGPARLTIGEAAVPKDVLAAISNSIELAVAKFGRPRVMRGGPSGYPPSVWNLNIDGGSRFCRPEGMLPVIWRADSAAQRELQIQDDETGEDVFVHWPKDSDRLEWPFPEGRGVDGAFLFDLPPDTTRTIEVMVIRDLTTDADLLQALSSAGCIYQLFLVSLNVPRTGGEPPQ